MSPVISLPGDRPGDRRATFEAELELFLRLLIEERFLYQNVDLPFAYEKLENAATLLKLPKDAARAAQDLKLLDQQWVVAHGGFAVPVAAPSADREDRNRLECRISTAKLHCVECAAAEAHNCAGAWIVGEQNTDTKSVHQVLVFTFGCQCCKRTNTSVMIERKGRRVALCGRSPMANVEVPTFVPKAHARFYRDAVIAFQCGQVLPALFMMRTFIEQFMRAATSSPARTGDDLAKDYTAKLPERLRGEMQSLGAVYADLSAAMHEARTDEVLFRDALCKIDMHFEQRQAFRSHFSVT